MPENFRVKALWEENEKLRLDLGAAQGMVRALEEESLTKAHRSLAVEAEIFRRERDAAERRVEELEKTLEFIRLRAAARRLYRRGGAQ